SLRLTSCLIGNEVSLLANCRISSTERKSSSAWAGDSFCCGAELACSAGGFCCGWGAVDGPELGGVPADPCCATACSKLRLSASSSARRLCVNARLKFRWWGRCRDESLEVGCELAILITISGIQRLNKLQGVPVNRARRASSTTRDLTSASFYIPLLLFRIKDRNSVRVSCSSRKQPNMEEVTAAECCFSTPRDRKSTRLNSSHVAISYAVFCLKKKKSPRRSSSSRQAKARLDLPADR